MRERWGVFQEGLTIVMGLRAYVMATVICCVAVVMNPVSAQSIVAHRGASRDAPENTLAAFRLAWDRGADAIEGDFRLSADRQIVCIHDDHTQRVADRKLIVAESSLGQLRALDVGSWKGARWIGERIPSLTQVLQTVPHGKRILIEIKCGPEIVPVLKEELDARWSRIETVIISFQQEVIAECKRQMPQVDAYWLTSFQRHPKTGVWEPSVETILDTLKRTQADGLDCKAEPAACTPELIDRVRGMGAEWHCWTVNNPDLALIFHGRGVDSITTDRPRFLRRHLPSSDLQEHLQMHLGFEGHTSDGSRHQRQVQLKVSSPDDEPRYPPAVFGQGLNLGGKHWVMTDYRLPETGAICLWYFAHEWYDYQTIFDQSRHPNAWELWIDNKAQLKFRLDARQKHPLHHRFHPVGDLNAWQHMALTWCRDDAGETIVWLFVNGTLSETAAFPAKQWTPIGSQFFLGGGHAGNTRGNGVMDDVFVFDCRLRRGDVYRLMRLGSHGLLDRSR
ncbi:MAG: glycerophosphodiester phosphodiesterase family protein [Planctomycetaceae bacterium]